MRSLVVANEAHRTGAPMVACQTARALAEFGEVLMVAKRGGALLDSFHEVASVLAPPLRRLQPWLARARFRGLPTGTRSLEISAARRIIDREMPDLVYAHTIETADFIRAAGQGGVPSVLHLHEPFGKVVEFLSPFGVDRSRPPSHVVGCSRATSRDAERYFGGSAPIATIPGPVDVDDVVRRARVSRPPDLGVTPFVVTVGSVTRVKGVDLWLDVVTRVRASGSRLRFVWIGDGPERAWAERELVARGLDDVAAMLGRRSDPVPHMAAADALLLTSRYEGMPLVILEALCASTPVAAFDVNGVAEAVGEHGRVAPAGDVDALAHAVLEVVGDAELRREVEIGAIERMRSAFDVHGFAAQTAEVVSRVVPSIG